jgi:hypothetical protein
MNNQGYAQAENLNRRGYAQSETMAPPVAAAPVALRALADALLQHAQGLHSRQNEIDTEIETLGAAMFGPTPTGAAGDTNKEPAPVGMEQVLHALGARLVTLEQRMCSASIRLREINGRL